MKILYLLRGKVKEGKKRGKRLGFPTANITLHKKIPEGIYASKVTIDKQDYLAATFIGASKTFRETELKCESFILNFDNEIYGKWITVKLIKKVRRNKKFSSVKKLIDQMEVDISNILMFFSKTKTN